MRLLEPAEVGVAGERSINVCGTTGVSYNDNLCLASELQPKSATITYPQYDVEPPCPPNRFKPLPRLRGEIKKFNRAFEKRQQKQHHCCMPHLPPMYRPVFSVPPAEYWTHVDICNPWHFFDRSACCDRARPYNWENDTCPTAYCRPGGKATAALVLPYTNLGLYFPPCQYLQVKC